MIANCVDADFDDMLAVINDGAASYRGIVPADCWHDPYMSREELSGEISAGVNFRGWFDETAALIGVMGAQPVSDVVLIRHAYVKTSRQRQGVGTALILDLLAAGEKTVLVGTWAAASWAVGFYRKHDFHLTSEAEKDRLLHRYWRVPERQIENSVVLAKRHRLDQNT